MIPTEIKGKELVYLACPYSHPDPVIMQQRYVMSNIIAGELMKLDYFIFSPISHSHPIAQQCNMDAIDHDFWLRQDCAIFMHCEMMMIIAIDGWEESYGIGLELIWAKDLDMPVVLVHVKDGKIIGFTQHEY